jgi:hypothetical protein
MGKERTNERPARLREGLVDRLVGWFVGMLCCYFPHIPDRTGTQDTHIHTYSRLGYNIITDRSTRV